MKKLLSGLSVKDMEDILLHPVHIHKDVIKEQWVIRRLEKQAVQNKKRHTPRRSTQSS